MILRILLSPLKKLCDLFVSCLIEFIFSDFFEYVRDGFRSPRNGHWDGQYHHSNNHTYPISVNIIFSPRDWLFGTSKVTFPSGEALSYIVTAKRNGKKFEMDYHSCANRPSFSMDVSYNQSDVLLFGNLKKTTNEGKGRSYPVYLKHNTLH